MGLWVEGAESACSCEAAQPIVRAPRQFNTERKRGEMAAAARENRPGMLPVCLKEECRPNVLT